MERIILARRILETTGLSVAEVARQSGLQDVSVFRCHFADHVGLSPTAYRCRFGRLNDISGDIQEEPTTKEPPG